MTYGLSLTGFTAATTEEIQAEVEAQLLADINAGLDLTPEGPLGQIVGIRSEREAVIWELLAVAFGSMDPRKAEGFLLDAVCLLTGVIRLSAKKTRVAVTLTHGLGFNAAVGAIQLNVTGNPNYKFTNVDAIPVQAAAGTYSAIFEAFEYGPIPVSAGTLTTITVAFPNLTSVTNPLDGVTGRLQEKDDALRIRRDASLSAAGSATAEALRADLQNLAGVISAFVFENETSTVDANGLPAKSFEAVIFDGVVPAASNSEIVQTIWKNKPAGIQTYGTSSGSLFDSNGTSRTLYYSRAAIRDVWLRVHVVVEQSKEPPGLVQLIKDAVATFAAGYQTLGMDVISAKIKGAAVSVASVLDCPTLQLDFTNTGALMPTNNLLINRREIASVDTSRIAVFVTYGTP